MASQNQDSFKEQFRLAGIDLRALLKHVTKENDLEENSQQTDMSGFSMVTINDESLTLEDRPEKIGLEAEEEQFDPELFIEEVRNLL